MLLDKMSFGEKEYPAKIERNILVILSCLSEKVAGTAVASILSEKTITPIFAILDNAKRYENQPFRLTRKEKAKLNVLLFAIITLEKFAMSSQSKSMIMSLLNEQQEENILIYLSKWINDENNLKHQIGFLAQYLLDNTCNLNR